MRARLLSSVSLLTILFVACGRNAKNPAAPDTAGVAAPVLRAISMSPSGVGLEGATRFTFSADTTATAPQSTFEWQFGDGSGATGGATTAHVFAHSGSFTVTVTVTNAAGQASASNTVRVASLVGTWIATITGHANFPSQRPIPITSVELELNQAPTGSAPTELAAIWRDDAGCRAGTGYPSAVLASVGEPRTLSIGVASLFCNDGAFYLNGTGDAEMNVITGTCVLGGPDCRFVMTRQ